MIIIESAQPLPPFTARCGKCGDTDVTTWLVPVQIPYGLTTRELIAAIAMQGLTCAANYDGGPTDAAIDAVNYADALLAALAKPAALPTKEEP